MQVTHILFNLQAPLFFVAQILNDGFNDVLKQIIQYLCRNKKWGRVLIFVFVHTSKSQFKSLILKIKNSFIMKKTILLFAAMALVTLGFFTSCDPAGTDDLPPVITITEPTADTIEVEIGSAVTFKVSLSSDNTLNSFQVMSDTDGVTFTNDSKTFSGTSDEVVEVTATVTNAVEAGKKIVVTFVVNDEKGTSNVKKVIVAKKTVVSLSAAQTFEWKRVGGAEGTGLAEFGLTWTSKN
jgi:hypothetical protein